MKVMSVLLLCRLGCILLSEGLQTSISCLQLLAMVCLRMLPQSSLRRKGPPVRAKDTGPILRGLCVLSLVLNP
jgi:hypothetical protein